MTTRLRRVSAEDALRRDVPVVAADTDAQARVIIEAVRRDGIRALRTYASMFDERTDREPLVLGRDAMHAALAGLDPDDRAALESAAQRIRTFAEAQREAVRPVEVPVPGGAAGHTIEPVDAAGCYAPAGRYPLPSSVLMTAITARAAGCRRVVVASPGAHPVMLAAAALADADEFLAIGGAHAIAALAYGFDDFSRCDVIAGPGNRWVTAAKRLVSGDVGIDMLAGPSELVVLADDAADPDLVAADLLAQAEHDVDAIPILVTTSGRLAAAVDEALTRRLETLTTRDTAAAALRNGFVTIDPNLDRCLTVVDALAPEHLEVMTADAAQAAGRIRNAGGVFIGAGSAEVLGDYGAGPNHTLPTGGSARFEAGLSVMHFLRLRTWLRVDDPGAAAGMVADTARIAMMEGLAGHRAAADLRRASITSSSGD